jgi:hypothetical protein
MALEQQIRKVELILKRYWEIKLKEGKKKNQEYWVLASFDHDRADLIAEELVEHQGPVLEILSGVLPGKTKRDRVHSVDLLDRLMTIPLEGLYATLRKKTKKDLR